MNTEYILQAQHLKKYFGSIHAVEDISLRVKQGEIFGFLGPNGAGKTTTISMILGLTYPTAGAVEVCGKEARMTARVIPTFSSTLYPGRPLGSTLHFHQSEPLRLNGCTSATAFTTFSTNVSISNDDISRATA